MCWSKKYSKASGGRAWVRARVMLRLKVRVSASRVRGFREQVVQRLAPPRPIQFANERSALPIS